MITPSTFSFIIDLSEAPAGERSAKNLEDSINSRGEAEVRTTLHDRGADKGISAEEALNMAHGVVAITVTIANNWPAIRQVLEDVSNWMRGHGRRKLVVRTEGRGAEISEDDTAEKIAEKLGCKAPQ